MASMEEIFEDKKKDILDKVDIIMSKMEDELDSHSYPDSFYEGCLEPIEWVKDRASDMMNAVGGRSRMVWSYETTKASKLLDAETSLRGMRYDKVGQWRIRWSHRGYNDLLELLADLASDVRTGKVKMHWPKYESLVEEVISKFFERYTIKPPKIESIPIRVFGLIGIDTLGKGYAGVGKKTLLNTKSEEYSGDRWSARKLLKTEIQEGKWDTEDIGPNGKKKYHFLFE